VQAEKGRLTNLLDSYNLLRIIVNRFVDRSKASSAQFLKQRILTGGVAAGDGIGICSLGAALLLRLGGWGIRTGRSLVLWDSDVSLGLYPRSGGRRHDEGKKRTEGSNAAPLTSWVEIVQRKTSSHVKQLPSP
jgi:hypothetical protein